MHAVYKNAREQPSPVVVRPLPLAAAPTTGSVRAAHEHIHRHLLPTQTDNRRPKPTLSPLDPRSNPQPSATVNMLTDRGPRLDGELWYHGNIGRTDAHARLSRHGAGTFLVRSKGGSKPGEAVEVLHAQCVLSFKVECYQGDYAEAVVHIQITRAQPDPTEDDTYATSPAAGLYSLVGKPLVTRPTIQALIEAYATIPPAERHGTLLTTPCPHPGETLCTSPDAGAPVTKAVDSPGEDLYTDLFSVAADPVVLASVRALAIKRHSYVADIPMREASRLRSLADTGNPPPSPTVAPRNFGLDACGTAPRSPRLRPLGDTDVFPPAACEPAAVDRHAQLSSSPSPRRSSLASPTSPGLHANNLRALHRSGGGTSGDGGSRRASGKYLDANSADAAQRRSAASSGHSTAPPATAATPPARRVTCL